MSWELDEVRRQLSNFKYDIYRKVESEEHRKDISNLENLIENKKSQLQRQIYDLERKLDQFIETYENDKMEIFSALQQTSK